MSGIRLSDYLPPTRDGRVFAGTALVDSCGTGLYLAGSAVYFVRTVGLSSAQVGTGLAVAGLVAFLAAVPVSSLSERIGALTLLRLLQLWRGCWFAVLAFVTGPWQFVAVSALMALAQGALAPMTQAVVGAVTEGADRTRTLAVVRTVRNAGFSLGALAAAPLLALDSSVALRAVILANAVSFVVAAVLLGRVRVAVTAAKAPARPGLRGLLAGFRDRRYLALTAVNGVLTLHMSMLSVGVPLWTVQHTPAPVGLVAVLTAVNTVLAILLQVPFTRAADTPRAVTRALRRAGWALAACCAVLALAASAGRWTAVALLVAATVLLTLGDLWQAIGGWELSYRFAPAERQARHLAVFSLGGSAQDVVGPLPIGTVVIGAGPVGWLGLGAVLLLGAALVDPVVAALDRPGRPSRLSTKESA